MTDIDTLWTGTGLELDVVGARPEIGLLRDGAESDDKYRERLSVRWVNIEMQKAIEEALFNANHPVINNAEEADVLCERVMLRLWGFVFGVAPREAGD